MTSGAALVRRSVVALVALALGATTVVSTGSTTEALGSTATTAAPAPASTTATGSPQLRRHGRWMVDPQGRVVIVHGFNLVYKHAPYAPPATKSGFLPRDARWLARHGFNGVRLGMLWAGLTPDQPDVVDTTYVDRVQRVADLLAKRHIWMQLDMHQDQWNELYLGEGVPDWAVLRPPEYASSPPVTGTFPNGYHAPELSAIFDNFWANEDGLLDDWAGAWALAAQQWRDQPYLMGYDLFNEPWMGAEWQSCLTTGCPGSYPTELQPAMERGLAAIRAVDPDNIVWWEPQQYFGGTAQKSYFKPVAGERQLGLSWHSYCPQVFLHSINPGSADFEACWSFDRNRERTARHQARTMNAVPLMSEWGATDSLRAVAIDADVADENLMGWTHWSYKLWHDPTTSGKDQGMFRNDANPASVKRAKLRLLVRTYAQATAGTPLAMSFDTDDGAFHYRYRPDPTITAPTRIFVSPLHYPHGYRVRVEHGHVVSRTHRHLRIAADSSHDVTVSVVRRRA